MGKKVAALLAYYPIGFYLGFALLVVAGFLYWAQVDLGWEFDWVQLKRWTAHNMMPILIVASALLGMVLISSAMAYRKVVNLSQEDYALWLHQKGTRVFFPIFTPLHDWLRMRSRIYNWWHTRTFSSTLNAALLVFTVIAIGNITTKTLVVAEASHGCVDTVSITSNTTWSTDQCHGDVTVSNAATLTINGGVTVDVTSLTLGNGVTNGFISAKGDTLNGVGVVINADGNIEIKSGSNINGDGQGYTGGASNSTGNGPGGGVGGSSIAAGGAGHGGNGGQGVGGNAGGAAYGNIDQPTTLGSGGGGGVAAGGAGGGAIKLNAPNGTVTIDGGIYVRGVSGGGICCPYAGAGAGGSIWVIANTLDGDGELHAYGHLASTGAGGGGGGRIKLGYTNNTSTLTGGKTQALGGWSGSNDTRGGAGTVVNGTLLYIANNGGIAYTNVAYTPLYDSNYNFGSFTARDYVTVLIGENTTLAGGTTTIQNNSVVFPLGVNSVWTGGALTVSGDGTTNIINVRPNVIAPPTFSSITVGSGTLTHWANYSTHDQSIVLNSTGDVTITGNINLDGRGYGGGNSGSQNGKGPGGGTTGGHGGGAGHGAYGGGAFSANNGGVQYGSRTQPTDLGSGGAYGSGGPGDGTWGGGAIKLTASGAISHSGTISANGVDTGGFSPPGGAGSGGSIWLVSSNISGNGTVRANGGKTTGSGNGGAGAGGRVQITFSSSTATWTKQAFGGNGIEGRGTRGGAGTVSATDGLAIINDPTYVFYSPPTVLNDSTITYSATALGNYATVQLDANTSLQGGDLTMSNATTNGTLLLNIPSAITAVPTFSSINVASNTIVTHPGNYDTQSWSISLNSTGNVTITGTINSNGKGYAGGNNGSQNGKGPGGGTGGNNGAGGGYGGDGGNSFSGMAGGVGSGSMTQPTSLGSGGGYGSGGPGDGTAGGGAVKITSTGTFNITGTISANGDDVGGFSPPGGAGSGGSVWLTAGTLTGNGTVTANGGRAPSNGGSGSGGRIQITYTTDSSTWTNQAFGGNPGNGMRGGAGTISMSESLVIANNSASSALSPLTRVLAGNFSYSASTFKDYSRTVVASGVTIESGATVIQNTSDVTLLGNDTVWSGTTLTTQTGANRIGIPVGITTKPYFSGNILIQNTLYTEDNFTTHNYSMILTSAGNITVDSGAIIEVSLAGYQGGQPSNNGSGPGGGQWGNAGAGAGHGGTGGNSSTGASGGGTYDSALNPVIAGSGGGAGNWGPSAGGDGGGAVELAAAGTVTITGTVSANGGTAGNYGGGGAGGSIKLIGNTIAGAGTLQANGGNGNAFGGACGGGGRIARHYNSSTFSGTVSVAAGGVYGTCGAGTNQTVGTVTDLVVTGITSPQNAGTSSSVTVEARDGSNNRNFSYSKTITFTSSDTQADLPANYAFTVVNAGQATISGVVLKTAGTQSVTADQSDDGTVDGSQSNITVNPGPAVTLSLSGIADPVTAGTVSSPVVTAKDTYNNTATGYTGTVTITSSDSQAVLPSNYTFIGGDAGTKTFTSGVTLKTAGEQTVTATDTVTSPITGTQSAITVNPGAVSTLTLSNIPASTVAGTSHSPTVSAKDAYDNPVTSYGGTVAFSSSDSAATLPANYTFVGSDNGTKTFTDTLIFKTSGTQSVTVTDGTRTGNSNGTVVTAGIASKLKVSNVTSPTSAGDKNSATVTAQDSFNNTVTGYSGTIKFTSTDATAILPANYTYVPTDSGIHVFSSSVTFNTAGTQSLTALDTANSSITGTLTGILVVAKENPTTPPIPTPTPIPDIEIIPSLSVVFIEPSAGQFTGTIEQEVNGVLLDVVVTGTIQGNKIIGTVIGTYGSESVSGSITGTLKGREIDTAQITLVNPNDPDFNLSILVSGVINLPNEGDTEPCKIRGTLETTINGKVFKGEVQMTIASDGSITGSAKGFLDDKKVFGRFTADSVDGEIVGGQVTLSENGSDKTTTGDIVGSVEDGEIVLSKAQNCNFPTDVEIDTDGDGVADGSGTGSVVIDDPVTGGDTITGGINAAVETGPYTDAIMTGSFETLVANIVLKPSGLNMTTVEQNELISDALAVVSGVALLPTLPAIQNVILTSSMRGMSLFHWYFFGYIPRKKRKFWGVIRDKTTHVPVVAALVRLLSIHSGAEIKNMRTDHAGRYGFLVERPGQYQVEVSDPMYAGYKTNEINIHKLSEPIVTGDIDLDPIAWRRNKLAAKTQLYLTVIKLLNIVHWPLLIGGTILSAWLVFEYPTTARIVVFCVYGILWISKVAGNRRERHFGKITDEAGNPISGAVIQLTNKKADVTSHVHSTVTNKLGHFVLLIKPGAYEVIVAKEGFITRKGAVIADEANMVVRLVRSSQVTLSESGRVDSVN